MSDIDLPPSELWRVVAKRNTEQGVIYHVKFYQFKETADDYVRWVEDPNEMRGAVLSVTKYVRATQ